jgi:cytosine/adenosine deaminase-related metal-dependent hydrolase
MPTGNMAASLFSPRDIYWGELGGALESIDAGTTTIVDHAHMNYSREHTTEGLKGMVEAGVRGFFAYGANPRVTDWEEFGFEEDVIPEWFMHQLHQLAGQKYGDGRVQVGLAWDTWYLPKEVVSKIFEQAREWGVKLITSHYVRGPTMSASLLPLLTWLTFVRHAPDRNNGVLGPFRPRYFNLPCHKRNF